MSFAVMSIVAVFLVASFVTAGSLMAESPLFNFRMEQASSKMNFSPGTGNGFTYTTQNGYILNCNVGNCCGKGIVLLGTDATCFPTCLSTCIVTCETCEGQPTCGSTCTPTCPYTCDDPTCPTTCEATCPSTCEETCDDPTCPYTCGLQQCPPTSISTCGIDCKETIFPACPE